MNATKRQMVSVVCGSFQRQGTLSVSSLELGVMGRENYRAQSGRRQTDIYSFIHPLVP